MFSARLTGLVIALTGAEFLAAAVVLARTSSERSLAEFALAAFLAAPATTAAVLVERRRPTASLGPMLALAGLLPSFALLNDIFKHGALSAYAVAISPGLWVLLYAPAALLVLFFPAGRLAGRDRRLAGVIVADALLFIAVGATFPGPYPRPFERSPHVFGVLPHSLAVIVVAITLPGILVTLLLTAASVVRRYRRSGGEARAQMKWLAVAAMVVPLALVAAWAGYVTVDVGDTIVLAGLAIAYAAIPAVIGIAVLRPQLFEVERVLASTATHAAGTAVVLAIFTAANLAAGLLFPGSSVPAAVAATSLCALLLAPLRARLQRRVDRWLYPARRAALAAIEELSRETVVAQARPEQLEEILRRAVGDQTLRVGFRTTDGERIVDAAGEQIGSSRATVPVRLGSEQIGVVGATRLSRELLADIAAAASPLAEVIRLRLGLREALAEVEASRSRLLRAGYEERQRLERDLHDGAQLRLVSLGMALRIAQRHLDDEKLDVHGLLDQAVDELGTAVGELRQLAHGIRPTCLDDGLAPALSVLVGNLPIPVEVQVVETDFDDDVQTTAYYVASEAIANAVKHSRATRIALHVDARGNDLYVRVEDDGVGGAAGRDGSGLARLTDRVSAHGGTLFVTSPMDGGTTVEAILPCAS